jgi:hypothetical protein
MHDITFLFCFSAARITANDNIRGMTPEISIHRHPIAPRKTH